MGSKPGHGPWFGPKKKKKLQGLPLAGWVPMRRPGEDLECAASASSFIAGMLLNLGLYFLLSSVQLLGHIQLFVTPGTAACQLPCPSPTPRACSNSCPSSPGHPNISSSVIPLFSCLQSFPVNQFFTSGGQSIGASASAPVLLLS